MKSRGVIISVEGNKARVQVTTASECMGCPSKSQCSPISTNNRELVVINDPGARVSDHVVFEADSGKVVLSAALIWIVPILAMIAGYQVAKRFSSGFLPIGTAFLFLGLTFGVLKLLDLKISGGRTFYPRITSIISTSDSGNDYCPDHLNGY